MKIFMGEKEIMWRKTAIFFILSFREYDGNFIKWTCGEEVNDFQAQATTNKNGFSRGEKITAYRSDTKFSR